MFETEQICPYTGLRAFTEEESLYFKGREEHIDQATLQLQRNKFLMLTGASGDGKSSLIYAGIIPNARAGFLRSKYTQWAVADFRPERNPFQNLCRSIARQLGIDNPHTVEAELGHGFSAIVDLYKNSKRNLDTNSMAWQNADEKGRAALKREASNLVILVDQFEEFFTNPENYHKGVPSRDANLVLNLLLETARIALEEDLPIYIVFTMRSDYIGQCAAFRGLPEYIGYSQFFVPRLNRTQLQQVIEEPAVLSGNRITRRLTERLIHDLTEGVDQLPILQHALNQVWHAADNGREEMDLLHYAKVGGMPVAELPEEQVDKFNTWFEGLATEIKACYHEPNLQNVLDTHTNKLYEEAAEYYKSKTGKQISDEDAKAIIRNAFVCLTKIDQSRAVRNRMTLQEITDILGRPEFGIRDVGAVLDIFREPGNTFIRPFISPEKADGELKGDDILDITHESLIRNWEYLEQWALKEYDHYTVSLDFEQQLNRWVDSGKSSGFLLSIGPLTYFENWFNLANPNAHWLARYLPEDIQEDKKMEKAEQILSNSKDFLARSAKRHMVTRTVMRYGMKKIAAVLGLVALLTLSSFAVRNYFLQKNDYVLGTIKERSFILANNKRLSPEFAVPLLTRQLVLGNTTISEIVENINDPEQKIIIVTAMATEMVSQGFSQPADEIRECLNITDTLLEKYCDRSAANDRSKQLKLVHDYAVTARFAYFLNTIPTLDSFVQHNAKRSADLAMRIFREKPAEFHDIQFLSLAMSDGMNSKLLPASDISYLIHELSPFENSERDSWVLDRYKRENVQRLGGNAYGFSYNGLYQDLGYLYAASGESALAARCTDSLLHYSSNYYQNDYASFVDNASHIAGYFYIYGRQDSLDAFVASYSRSKDVIRVEFYKRLTAACMININTGFDFYFYSGGGGQELSNLELKFSSDSMLSFFFDKLKESIRILPGNDQQNMEMALALKNQGALLGARNEMRGHPGKGDSYFKEAIDHFLLVSTAELEKGVIVDNKGGGTATNYPNKYLFLYPDFRVPFHPFEPRANLNIYNSGSFINYLLDHDLIDTLYKQERDLKYFEEWLLAYQNAMGASNWLIKDQLPVSLMERIELKIRQRDPRHNVDINILYLHLANREFNDQQGSKAISYAERINEANLLNSFQETNNGNTNSYTFELISNIVAGLGANNRFDLVSKLVNVFKKKPNRSSIYGYASQLLSLQRKDPVIARRFTDSAMAEMKRIDKPDFFEPHKAQIALALMFMDPLANEKEATGVIKNTQVRFDALYQYGETFAFHDKLYEATKRMPPLFSSGDQAYFLKYTIVGYNFRKEVDAKWKKFLDNEFILSRRYLPYVDEN